MYVMNLHRRYSKQLAIDLQDCLGRRLNTYLTTLSMKHMTDGIYTTIKEAAKAEDNVPPVDRSNECDVEQAIVGNSLGELLHTTTVVLTDTDSYAEEEAVGDELIVDP
mgnify:CR=1 FL=1